MTINQKQQFVSVTFSHVCLAHPSTYKAVIRVLDGESETISFQVNYEGLLTHCEEVFTLKPWKQQANEETQFDYVEANVQTEKDPNSLQVTVLKYLENGNEEVYCRGEISLETQHPLFTKHDLTNARKGMVGMFTSTKITKENVGWLTYFKVFGPADEHVDSDVDSVRDLLVTPGLPKKLAGKAFFNKGSSSVRGGVASSGKKSVKYRTKYSKEDVKEKARILLQSKHTSSGKVFSRTPQVTKVRSNLLQKTSDAFRKRDLIKRTPVMNENKEEELEIQTSSTNSEDSLECHYSFNGDDESILEITQLQTASKVDISPSNDNVENTNPVQMLLPKFHQLSTQSPPLHSSSVLPHVPIKEPEMEVSSTANNDGLVLTTQARNNLDEHVVAVLDHQTKEVMHYRSIIRKLGNDIRNLRDHADSLRHENSELVTKLHLMACSSDIATKDAVGKLKKLLAKELTEKNELRYRVNELQSTIIQTNKNEYNSLQLQAAHKEQQTVMLTLQGKLGKYNRLKETCEKQEMVIEGLETKLANIANVSITRLDASEQASGTKQASNSLTRKHLAREAIEANVKAIDNQICKNEELQACYAKIGRLEEQLASLTTQLQIEKSSNRVIEVDNIGPRVRDAKLRASLPTSNRDYFPAKKSRDQQFMRYSYNSRNRFC